MVSICAIDPVVTVIWCSGMAGISAWLTGGFICIWNLAVYESLSIDLPLHWYFLIYCYMLTVSNGLSLTTLNSEEFTLPSGSFEWVGGVWGSICLWYLAVYECLYIAVDLPLHWYFLIYSYMLTVLNRISLTTLNSEEAVLTGGFICQQLGHPPPPTLPLPSPLLDGTLLSILFFSSMI